MRANNGEQQAPARLTNPSCFQPHCQSHHGYHSEEGCTFQSTAYKPCCVDGCDQSQPPPADPRPTPGASERVLNPRCKRACMPADWLACCCCHCCHCCYFAYATPGTRPAPLLQRSSAAGSAFERGHGGWPGSGQPPSPSSIGPASATWPVAWVRGCGVGARPLAARGPLSISP